MQRMLKGLVAVMLISVVVLLSACTSKNITSDYVLNKESGQGLLIVKLIKRGTGTTESAKINIIRDDGRFIDNLYFVTQTKDSYYVISLQEGKYNFCNIKFHGYLAPKHGCRIDDKFEIKAGEITYAGEKEVHMEAPSGRLSWRIKHYRSFNPAFVNQIAEDYPNIDICKMRNLYYQPYMENDYSGKCSSDPSPDAS